MTRKTNDPASDERVSTDSEGDDPAGVDAESVAAYLGRNPDFFATRPDLLAGMEAPSRWTGDGMKADFPTASAALATAMDMQRAVSAYSQSDDAVSPFQIRIGVSAGEVVMEGNEAHGIAVIEDAAEALGATYHGGAAGSFGDLAVL